MSFFDPYLPTVYFCEISAASDDMIVSLFNDINKIKRYNKSSFQILSRTKTGVFLKMHLWSILCCCCKEDTEKYEHMKEDTSGVVKKELSVKKPSFPRIVIQVKLKIVKSNGFQ